MPVHHFSAYQRELRDKWFNLPETDEPWIDEGPIGEGESASIRVRNTVDDMWSVLQNLGRPKQLRKTTVVPLMKN